MPVAKQDPKLMRELPFESFAWTKFTRRFTLLQPL